MDWSVIVSAAATIVIAVIEGIAASERKRNKAYAEKSERRASDRAEESKLAMRMMDASLELALATALALEHNKLNGEMKWAKERATAARCDYQCFLEMITAREMTKL